MIVIGGRGEFGRYFDDEGNIYNYNFDTMSVDIYDLEEVDSGEIRLLRSDSFRGTYKTSRLIDGDVYLLTNYNSTYGEVYVDYFAGNTDFSITYRDESGNGYFTGGYLIAKLDLDADAQAGYRTALYADSEVYDIYCSPYAFYAMKRGYIRNYGCGGYGWMSTGRYGYGATTESIDRIALDTLERTGTASGFNGLSPDRFCLHDNGEYLFVVNQKLYRKAGDERDAGSYVYVFDPEMNEAACLGPLAPGETLYSARMGGGICYLVTAKQVYRTVDPISLAPLPEPVIIDPLFKIDISDPLNPRYLGELEIEGFSTYMQDFGEGRLVGIGRNGSGRDLKVSLFNTSGDVPEEINSLLFENGYAEAESEARAILCEPDNNLFAFSTRFADGATAAYGALILGITDGELAQRAFLREPYPDVDYSRQRIRRVVRIGGYLLTVSDAYIASYPLSGVLENAAEPIDLLDTRIDDGDLFCTVRFVIGIDGISYPDRRVEFRYFATLPNPPDIEGEWEFGYWSTSNPAYGNGRMFSQHEIVSQDMTLYAKWYKLPWREVEFDLNLPDGIQAGVTGTNGFSTTWVYAPAKQTVEDGGMLVYPHNLQPGLVIEGYKLTHWYKDDPDTAYSFNAPVTGSFTLRARWKKIVTYTVALDYNYPSGSDYTQILLVEQGTRMTAPYIAQSWQTADAIYRFVFWYSGNSNTPYSFASPVTGDLTLHAKWQKVVTHKVTFSYHYPDSKNVTSTEIVENGAKVSEPYMSIYTVREGQLYVQYKFEYWYRDNSNTPYNFNSPITKDLTLHAKWRKVII